MTDTPRKRFPTLLATLACLAAAAMYVGIFIGLVYAGVIEIPAEIIVRQDDGRSSQEERNDALRWVSRENGVVEVAQMSVWAAAAVLAAWFAWRRRGGDARNVLILLTVGAVMVAAREADLHEVLNPKIKQQAAENPGKRDGNNRNKLDPATTQSPTTLTAATQTAAESRPATREGKPKPAQNDKQTGPLGEWGVRFRGDWWVSPHTPILPRLLWATIAIGSVIGGVYIVRKAAPPLVRRDGSLRGLLRPLMIVAGLFLLAWGLDDLFRYRVPLRVSQMIEEWLELSSALLFAVVVLTCAKWSRAGDLKV